MEEFYVSDLTARMQGASSQTRARPSRENSLSSPTRQPLYTNEHNHERTRNTLSEPSVQRFGDEQD